MTKAELVKRWHESTAQTHSLAEVASLFDVLCRVIGAELLTGGEVSLPHIGKLKNKRTVARKGRNPKTGAAIDIPAKRKAVFVMAKGLKESLN